jgi:DNA polymerase I-like protein with 3'-5' exonuclease and polymerase domains
MMMYIGTEKDNSYLAKLKQALAGFNCKVITREVPDVPILHEVLKSKGVEKVLFSSLAILEFFIKKEFKGNSKLSIDNYVGSMFNYKGMEFCAVLPADRLYSSTYGEFIFRRMASKFAEPEKFFPCPEFNWVSVEDKDCEEMLLTLSNSSFISIDIETAREPVPHITHIAYTGVFWEEEGKVYTTKSYSFRLDTMYKYEVAKKINNYLQPKIFQNGRYDNAYLLAYDLQPTNYLYDTNYLFNCYYSELPKKLAFLAPFFIRDVKYWKDLSDTNNEYIYRQYNALDTWSTACVFLAMIHEMPEWAINNYVMKFPANYPAMMCEATGLKVDVDSMLRVAKESKFESDARLLRLRKRIGEMEFNPNSPKQVVNLLKLLGHSVDSSDEATLVRASEADPLTSLILSDILEIRGLNKVISTYLDTDKLYKGTLLFSVNPHGTDSGRSASGEHAFWCGSNIQNQPRGNKVKQCYIAPDEFVLAEADYKMAESFGTGYISGDENLLKALHSGDDFHSRNASAFFGIPYEQIYDNASKKKLMGELRDLAKRVNHGANYVMTAPVLLTTMGGANVDKAARLLGLPKNWTRKKVCEFLLEQFHKTYPDISGVYYPGVIHDVLTTQRLVGATGWTRYCFGRPDLEKRALNMYAAHCPQSLNAMILEASFIDIFQNISINPKYRDHFKLIAPIHDSIFFRFRKGHDYILDMVKEAMERNVPVEGYDGVTRVLRVPVDFKAGADNKGAYRWSETEA